MMYLVETKNMHISFKNKKIIDGLDLKFLQGKITSIIGPNGSGKTTILRAICRNVKLKQGTITLNGRDVFSYSAKAFAREVAFLSQNHECPEDIAVEELVRYGRYAHKSLWKGNTKEDNSAVKWALEMTGMTDFADRSMGTLSGGEKQRAWISMALAQKPKLLVLDEPTTYLDICYQLEVLELIKRLNRDQGITVIMVLHDINQAARFSDEIVIIKNGKVFTSGSPYDVLNTGNLRKVFGVETDINYDSSGGNPVFYPKCIACSCYR
ncbi:MAG TPA: iron ABC transporter ATP-binding protein [Clostridiaceae bacterium]|nr:iron ABC transporter ATP-binding protein [Clostridiaceae bacterium]